MEHPEYALKTRFSVDWKVSCFDGKEFLSSAHHGETNVASVFKIA